MQDILVVVDMQNDFVDGALGTPEAVQIVPRVVQRIQNFQGQVIFTRDTHAPDYLASREGRELPVPHCIRGSRGWEICPELAPLCRESTVVDKPSFGSVQLGELLVKADEQEKISSITLIGLCTDICVISNALLLRAFLPEAEVIVDASCCAGVTPEKHQTALRTMRSCQIKIEQ